MDRYFFYVHPTPARIINIRGAPPTRLIVGIAVLISTLPAHAQELGNKVLGTLGLLAGAQPGQGIYVADRLLYYTANELIDRNGHSIPGGLDLNALANAVGVQVTFQLPWHSLYWNATVGVPATHLALQNDSPEVSIDRFGLNDLYVQPVRIGWKMPRLNLVVGYSFYAPTAAPGTSGGLGRGYWTNQFSFGSALYFDRAKTWHLSEFVSYDSNGRRRDIDLTRGNTVQFQGGAGKTLGIVIMGLAGYGLWQVRDDRGTAVPESLRGARDRAFGLGPEIDISWAAIRTRFTLRYCHDVAVKTRPFGQILVFGVTVLAHP